MVGIIKIEIKELPSAKRINSILKKYHLKLSYIKNFDNRMIGIYCQTKELLDDEVLDEIKRKFNAYYIVRVISRAEWTPVFDEHSFVGVIPANSV